MTSKPAWPGPTPFALSSMITTPHIDTYGPGAQRTGKTLRKQAEKILMEQRIVSPGNLKDLSIEEIQRAFHELQVHQIELELQNEELRRIQNDLEVARTRYLNLYDLAPIGYCTISETGLILEANLTAARLLGVEREELIRQLLSRFIFNEDQNRYYQLRKRLFETFSVLRQNPRQASAVQAGVLHDCDLRIVAKSGAVFWGNMKMSVAENAACAPVYPMLLSNISKRKQAEA